MEKWMELTAPFIENVPGPKSLGTTLKLMKTVDEQRIHAYNHSYQEVKSPIDPRLTKLTIDSELYPALEAIIYELRTYNTKPILKPSKSMEKFNDLRLDSLDSRIELNSQKHLYSLLTLSKYNPTMIDPLKYEEALRMTLYYKTSKYHRLSVLSLMEELLNRQHTDINKLFQNDIYLFYAFAILISEFSPNNVSILAPAPKLNGSSNNIIVFNHANSSFLELYYTLIIFKRFERKKEEFPNAYHLFSDRINGLSFQSNEILKTFTSDLLSAVKENLNENSLDYISLTYFLIIISAALFLEQFLVNPEFPFFTFLKNIYQIDAKKTIRFCEQLFITKSAAVTMLPLLFEMFSQHYPEDFAID
ncbi:hypothetical protein TVAG_003290 [Trichomonas vaginalis G3]|uniref:Uncharacterized protein n=1 Tax=Trichomonas vaginalis (strain ATCC PRA-98 / G3) TaxID=412133 RepID=A2FN81_TRIV3|nr:hypothetical protein TVAGG3_0669570 [Trichomonas vaginalis G3]EAX93640.1 hypothetical protein TVAG_003290 [Trichomonas vaginalis G3]KAI5507092.1 hypothetical protein TVAGG3_0669570 [Trichomonas vaginalis G3]|eukprot:XP_001306570.1 hypothetical protein [Trichomonas vaginalis G3]